MHHPVIEAMVGTGTVGLSYNHPDKAGMMGWTDRSGYIFLVSQSCDVGKVRLNTFCERGEKTLPSDGECAVEMYSNFAHHHNGKKKKKKVSDSETGKTYA